MRIASLIITSLFIVIITFTESIAQDDTLLKNNKGKLNHSKKGVVAVEPEEIPVDVRRTLSESEQYEGWEEADFYYEKRKKIYIVYVGDGNEERVFRFDKKGNPITDHTSARRKKDEY
ncbi:hypothetical protein [Chryseosolibacter indicus]|uniref:PepSY domain-containing protein n=1 Tax=Chryseosolibacter indicus TaxID=2782351 RepID=A0ABS5VRW3_9BACT|nr:hypothetical protein [Chryseosolibacter indicus]MBT1702751.1 hypothetical protein [Chryseosolibacter indicus]